MHGRDRIYAPSLSGQPASQAQPTNAYLPTFIFTKWLYHNHVVVSPSWIYGWRPATPIRLQLVSQHDASEQRVMHDALKDVSQQHYWIESRRTLQVASHKTEEIHVIRLVSLSGTTGRMPQHDAPSRKVCPQQSESKNISYSHISLMIYLDLLDPPNKP
jgi:hypothetical protein